MMNTLASWLSRRRFVQGTGFLSLLRTSPKDNQATTRTRQHIYQRLGVQTFINAAGNYTLLSSVLMPPEVIAAMNEAAQYYVAIPELHEAVGKRIAALLGAEAALVTAGAAAALTQATAACVTGKDQEKINLLPDMTNLKREVIIQKSHRFNFDHAIRAAGVKLIEVETRAQLESVIGAKTALLFFLNKAESLGQIQRKEFVAIAWKHNIPTLLDAAADIPPFGRLFEYQRLGFDLIALSGGKALRGPQNSGLLFGRADLVAAAYLNGSPNAHSLARNAKVRKETIIGLLTALELYRKRDHQAEWREWERRVNELAARLADLRGIKTEKFTPEYVNPAPHLRVEWDERVIPLKRAEAIKLLREGQPRIEVAPTPTDNPVLEIAVWTLQPGEHQIVAEQMRKLFQERLHR